MAKKPWTSQYLVSYRKCDHSLKHFGDLVCNFTGNKVKIAVAAGKNMRPSFIKVCCPLTDIFRTVVFGMVLHVNGASTIIISAL